MTENSSGMRVAHLSDSFPSPRITKLAAGVLLFACDTGRYLALHDTSRKIWGIPGGLLEPGETFEEGAMRELSEETRHTREVLDFTALPLFTAERSYGTLVYQTYFAAVEKQFPPLLDKENTNWSWVCGLDDWLVPHHEGIAFLQKNKECSQIIRQKTLRLCCPPGSSLSLKSQRHYIHL